MDNTVALGQAYMADITPLRERPRYFAQLESVMNFTQCIGPLVGGILSKVDLYIPLYLLHVYSNPRYLAIVLYAFSFFYAFFLLPESVYSVVEKKEILATFNRVNQSDRGRTSLLDMGTRFAEWSPPRGIAANSRGVFEANANAGYAISLFLSSHRDGANEEREAHDELPDRDRDYRRVLQQMGVQHLRHGGFDLRHGALPARRLHVRRDELHRQSRQHGPDRLALHLPHPQGLLHPHHGFLGRHCGR